MAHKARIAIFGAISVEIGDRTLGPKDFGGVKPKQLFEILLIGRGNPVPKDRVADLLWGDDPPQNISASIETYISVLRKSLDPVGDAGRRLVRTEREAYAIDLDLASLDIDELNEHLQRAEHAVGWTKRHHLEAALQIGAAELLADEPYADWAVRVRDHYAQRLREAGIAAAEAALETGDWLSTHRHADRIIHGDPWNEAAYRQLMIALVGMGRRPDAVLAFRRLQAVLREEVGLEPDRLTVDVIDLITTGADVETLVSTGSTAGRPIELEPALEQRMQLLLVEDNPADIRLVQESIRESGRPMDLEVATDGEAALSLLRSERLRPDLVLLDLNLPKLDGAAVLEQIKESHELRRIPVVILTTSTAEEDVLRSYDLHANGYLTKPSDLDGFTDLLRAIEAYWPRVTQAPIDV